MIAFFLKEDEKENGSELVVDSLGSLPKANIYERYLLGYLLTGKQNDLALRTVNDLVQSVHRSDEVDSLNFFLSLHCAEFCSIRFVQKHLVVFTNGTGSGRGEGCGERKEANSIY